MAGNTRWRVAGPCLFLTKCPASARRLAGLYRLSRENRPFHMRVAPMRVSGHSALVSGLVSW